MARYLMKSFGALQALQLAVIHPPSEQASSSANPFIYHLVAHHRNDRASAMICSVFHHLRLGPNGERAPFSSGHSESPELERQMI